MTRRPVALVSMCLAAAACAAWAGPARGHGAPTGAEVAKAVGVWERYAQCERTRRFEPCFALLSRNVLRVWAERDLGTATEYGVAKASDETSYDGFTVIRTRKSPARIVLVVRARGRSGGGPFSQVLEYALVKEGGEWKIDGKRLDQHQDLP